MNPPQQAPEHPELHALRLRMEQWARELGFDQLGVTDTDLSEAEGHLANWLKRGDHASLDYMHRHGHKRTRPAELVPGTLRVVSVRMNYLPPDTQPLRILADPSMAYISRYALGRDYHKTVRKRLATLAERIHTELSGLGYRVFVDSAPVMEKALAAKAGLGWIGKNTLLLNREAGSWFFLGEIYLDAPLPLDPQPDRTGSCGRCSACLDVCPTGAFRGPYQLNARRCISYLTIENRGPIPESLRPLMGNRVFGCDDCQWVCPWNRFAKHSSEGDFQARHGLDAMELLTLFNWDEATFLERTAGSPIRRAGYSGFRRNLVVALGNWLRSAPLEADCERAVVALSAAAEAADTSELLREHLQWALDQLTPEARKKWVR
ncbi:MAG: tRNA epoxyqueuosine(34) reductase QueG [Pseudomonadota bacterium]|nr:tRNA epoxyqueuosine(34) reductase QueG [Pseudomonadota bacterium]